MGTGTVTTGRGNSRALLILGSVPFVFFPGGDAAPDVALGLVHLQHLLYLKIQGLVKGREPLGQVLMYR